MWAEFSQVFIVFKEKSLKKLVLFLQCWQLMKLKKKKTFFQTQVFLWTEQSSEEYRLIHTVGMR